MSSFHDISSATVSLIATGQKKVDETSSEDVKSSVNSAVDQTKAAASVRFPPLPAPMAQCKELTTPWLQDAKQSAQNTTA